MVSNSIGKSQTTIEFILDTRRGIYLYIYVVYTINTKSFKKYKGPSVVTNTAKGRSTGWHCQSSMNNEVVYVKYVRTVKQNEKQQHKKIKIEEEEEEEYLLDRFPFSTLNVRPVLIFKLSFLFYWKCRLLIAIYNMV